MKPLRLLSPVLLALLLLLFIHAGLALADGPLAWQKLPGPEGGYACPVVIDPTNPDILYITTGAGVFKSTDGGASWAAASTNSPFFFAEDLVLDPQTPTTLYAAGQTGNQQNTEIFKSVDGGHSWQWSNTGLQGQYLRQFAINPLTPTVLYVAAGSGGVYRSTNSGQSWQPVNNGLAGKYIYAIAIDPLTPTTLFAATTNEIFKTVNSGQNWQSLTNTVDIFILRVDPITPTNIYAAGNGGAYKSVNGGQTWQVMNNGFGNNFVGALAIHPLTPTLLYAATMDGIYTSVNSGENWNLTHTIERGRFVEWLALESSRPTTLFAGTFSDGVYKSVDGGQSWQPMNHGLNNRRIYSLLADPLTPTTLYAGGEGLAKSSDNGQTWQLLPVPGSPNFFVVWSLAIDPANPNWLYAAGNIIGETLGTENAIFRSSDAGLNWSPVFTGLDIMPTPYFNIVVLNPLTPTILYVAGTGGVYKTTNRGDTWTLVNNGFNQSANALAMDPADPDTLYTGGYNGEVFKTITGGQSWQKIHQFPDSTGFGAPSVDVLVVDSLISTTLYAVLNTFEGVSMVSSIYQSRDGGQNWQEITENLPPTYLYQNQRLAVDPNWLDILYVGLDDGVYRRSGSGWQAVGLPYVYSVDALLTVPLSPTVLYAGTATGLYRATLPDKWWVYYFPLILKTN